MTTTELIDEEKSVVAESLCYPFADAKDYKRRFNILAKHTKSEPSLLIDWGIESKSQFVRFLLDSYKIEKVGDEYRMVIPLGKKKDTGYNSAD